MIGDFVGSEGSSVGADQLAVGLALGKDFKRFQPHGIEGMRAEPVLWIGLLRGYLASKIIELRQVVPSTYSSARTELD